jgi:excinuclease UvrABC helicase subunit UvrB
MSHNKTLQRSPSDSNTLPAQRREYCEYFDYYQLEVEPGHDIYIEKDSSINEEIERLWFRGDSLRPGATQSSCASPAWPRREVSQMLVTINAAR